MDEYTYTTGPIVPRSQSLIPNPSCSSSLTVSSQLPIRASSISSICSSSSSSATTTGGYTNKRSRRLSRKLPPAWTESLENLSNQHTYTSSSSIHSGNNISPMSKTISLPVPESSVITDFGGFTMNTNTNDSSRPYVLDVDRPIMDKPTQGPLRIDRSSSSSSSTSDSSTFDTNNLFTTTSATQTSSPLKKKSIKANSISGPFTASPGQTPVTNTNNMRMFKSSSKSSSSRSDILLTPRHSHYRQSLDSSLRCSASGSGSGSCGTWSLFDEAQLEDSLSIRSSTKYKVKKETRKEKKERTKMEKESFDQDTPPNHRMLFEASLLEVIDEQGKRRKFGDLVRGRKTIVIFIRHWYCPLCAQYMNSILTQVSLDALEEANVDLIIIGNGSDKMLNGYRNKSFRCPFKMYTDPTLALYRALGLTRQTGDGGDDDDKGDYLVQSAMESTLQTIKRATKMPLKNPGHFTQLGGEFIFDGTLNVTYTHRMTTTRSHAPIRDICAEAGVRLEFIHYEPGPPPPPVHRHSFFGLSTTQEEPSAEISERDQWQKQRDETINRIKALKLARREGLKSLEGQDGLVFDKRSKVVDNVRIVGQDVDEDEVVMSFSALGIAA
ncbi:uncharacterized protein IL334_003094 [Kwoniella shivajii]|uniref:Thioredoxin domain-containing protein n=1 Tax=Kwoniella shivajii TaxID=564305 RepID=A0ABZ1CZK7_9TREE|nr:hypothetical protein IL334_003094 [Kwoniella shivajii]